MKNASASGSSKSQMLPNLIPLPVSKYFRFHKNITTSAASDSVSTSLESGLLVLFSLKLTLHKLPVRLILIYSSYTFFFEFTVERTLAISHFCHLPSLVTILVTG